MFEDSLSRSVRNMLQVLKPGNGRHLKGKKKADEIITNIRNGGDKRKVGNKSTPPLPSPLQLRKANRHQRLNKAQQAPPRVPKSNQSKKSSEEEMKGIKNT